jgi:hypothetical protein
VENTEISFFSQALKAIFKLKTNNIIFHFITLPFND